MRYAYNAKVLSWFDEVQLLVMGPSIKALAADEKLQGYFKELIDNGVEVKISSDTAEAYGVADQLE